MNKKKHNNNNNNNNNNNKKTETIEYQEEKKKKQLHNKEPVNNELPLPKERKNFKNIYDKRLGKIYELSKKLIMMTWNSLLIVMVYNPILVN